MSYLTAGDISSMRDAVEGGLPNLCSIKQPVVVNTGSGPTITYSNLSTNVACRIAPLLPARENVIGGLLQGSSEYVITLPWNQAIQNDYRISVNSADTYEVKSIMERAAWTLGLRVICIKVAQED